MREKYSVPPADHSLQTAGKKHEDKREQTAGFPSQNFFGSPDLPSCVCAATSST